jgi:hypothetical protein
MERREAAMALPDFLMAEEVGGASGEDEFVSGCWDDDDLDPFDCEDDFFLGGDCSFASCSPSVGLPVVRVSMYLVALRAQDHTTSVSIHFEVKGRDEEDARC